MALTSPLEEAQANLYRAKQAEELGFSSTFEEQQGFGSWFSSGLTGLLTSKFASEETQEEWFVDRHSLNYNILGYGVNQVDKILDSYFELGNHRDYTQAEFNEIKELQRRKQTLEDDLSYVYQNFNGNLDAPMDVEGKSLNERWGVGGEEQDMLMAFLGAVKDNPAYMAGVFTSEILKDLPLSVLAWLGLAGKGAGGAKAINSALNKLNGIQPKILRGLTKVGTGVGAGAVAGASYEGLYSLLDEGEVKAKNVQAGASFGAAFGVLGGLGILGRTAKDLQARQPKKQVATKETPETPVKDVEDTVDSLVPEKQAKELQAPMELMFKEHNKHLFPELVEGTDYKVIHDIQVAKKQGVQKLNQTKAAQLRKDKDGTPVIVIDDKLVDASIKKFRKEMKEDKDKWFSSLTPTELTLLKGNKDVYKAFLVAHELGHVKQNKMGFPEVSTKEQHLAKEKGANDLAVEEMRRSYEEIQANKLNASDRDIAQIKDKLRARLRTPEEEQPREPTAVGQVLDRAGQAFNAATGTTGRRYGIAAGAGALAYAATSEEGDPLASAAGVAGAIALGPRVYRTLSGKGLQKNIMKAKAKISQGLEADANEMKQLDAQMQFLIEDIEKHFVSQDLGNFLIDFIETGKEGRYKFTPVQREIADRTKALLDDIGRQAVDAGVLAKAGTTNKVKFGMFEKRQKGSFLNNYFPHIFKGEIDEDVIEMLVKHWGKTSSRNANVRTIQGTVKQIKEKQDNLRKKKEAGGKLTKLEEKFLNMELIDNPVHVLNVYTQAMTRAIIGKRTVNSMKNLDLGGGGKDAMMLPALLSKKDLDALSKGESRYFNKQDTLHYQEFKHPSLEGLVAHTNVKHLLDDFFAISNKGGIGGTMEKVLKLNNGLKRIFVFGSLFHGQALFMSAVYSLGVSGAMKLATGKGKLGSVDVSRLKLGTEHFKETAIEAIKDGLGIINIKRQELVNPGKVPVDELLEKLGGPGALMSKAFDKIDYLTWEYLHDRFKLAAYLRHKERALKAGISPEVAGKKAAEFANDAFGSLDWNNFTTRLYNYASENPTKLRGKAANKLAELLPVNKRRWLNLGLFAPDWTISNIRIIGKTFTGLPEVSKAMAKRIQHGNWDFDPDAKDVVKAWNMYAAYAGRAGVYTSAMWWMMSELFSDEEPTMEGLWDFWSGDDSGKLNLGGGESMVISKQIAEPIHWLQHPQHTLMNKASVVPKTMMEAMFNKQWFSIKKGFPMGPRLVEDDGTQHYAKWILGKAVPIVTKPMFDESIEWDERFERVFTGFFGFPQYGTPED